MKKSIKRLLLLAAVLPATITASAYDFEVDGVYYNVVSFSELTCKVTQKGYYSGDIVIPATVDYANRTLTVVEMRTKYSEIVLT